MTQITITDESLKLSKTSFETAEDLILELMKVKHEQFELSPEHINIIKEREREADESKEPGKSWEEVRASLRRRNG